MRKFDGKLAGLAALVLLVAVAARSEAREAPKSLAEVGELGENVYDMAKAKDWAKAGEKYKELEVAARQLAGDLKEGKAEKDRLEGAVKALGGALKAKDRVETLRQSNQVTLIAADLNEPFKPKVPAAVTRLDYFGRQVEIGAESKDKDVLKAAAEGLHTNWDKVKAAAKAGGGIAEAKRFEALLTQIDAAKSPEEFGKVAKPILDEVDNLEKVFSK